MNKAGKSLVTLVHKAIFLIAFYNLLGEYATVSVCKSEDDLEERFSPSIGSLLPLCLFQGLNLSYQSWQQAPLTTASLEAILIYTNIFPKIF